MEIINHLKLFVFIGAAVSASSFAGTMSTGGAEFIGDDHNPWFIQNTAAVTFCIKHNPSTFHLPRGSDDQFLSKKVETVLNFWKREFKATHAMTDRPNYQVATQTFTETSCTADTDITFQFGVLEPDQIATLKTPKKYLAANVRTSYDNVHLRGKGFIYLAADEGPLAPSDENLAPRPWSMGTGGLIESALAHELGHVFGLQHTKEFGGSYHTQYMGETFLQWKLHRFNAGYDSTIDFDTWDVHFFSYRKNGGSWYEGYSGWSGDDYTRMARYFGYKDRVDFVYLDFSQSPVLNVYAVVKADSNDFNPAKIHIGSAEMKLSKTSSMLETQRMWITKDQTLYPCKEIVCGVTGPAILKEEWHGKFVNPTTQTTRALFIQRAPNSSYNLSNFRVGGVGDDGEIVFDLYDALPVYAPRQ